MPDYYDIEGKRLTASAYMRQFKVISWEGKSYLVEERSSYYPDNPALRPKHMIELKELNDHAKI